MNLTFYNLKDDIKDLKKLNTLNSSTGTLSGEIVGEYSTTNPSIRVNDMPSGNYVHIDTFNRYYFVSDVIIERNHICVLNLKSDPLTSFKDSILTSYVTTVRTSAGTIVDTKDFKSTPVGVLVNDTQYGTLAGMNTKIYSFPQGFTTSGKYILTVAGN